MNLNGNKDRINLNDIANISEDDFRQQITAWIDDRGISNKLQSKLRADLFEQFNRTHLGRQMNEQHQSSHRIVLSPLILVLNTLVAEFLYIENCHFTLSVFSNEVPYKNTLPNFEATPSKQLFRFSDTELRDIFEAIGLKAPTKQIVRKLYADCIADIQNGTMNKSLLHCLFKVAIREFGSSTGKSSNGSLPENQKKSRKKETHASITSENFSNSSQSKSPTHCSKSTHSKLDRDCRMSSRCFKYVNQYLDVLSERIHDISRNMIDKRSDRQNRRASDSSAQESSLKKDLRQMIDSFNQMTKSKRESQRFKDVLNSIERLSMNIDKCSENMDNLLLAINKQTKIAPQDTANTNEVEQNRDRLEQMDYGAWLKELKTSVNGKKFIDRLEMSLQKTMQKERDILDKLYEEKIANYRMLIRLHYKQKYEKTPNKREQGHSAESSSEEKVTNDNGEKVLAEQLSAQALEKEQHLDRIVQTAK